MVGGGCGGGALSVVKVSVGKDTVLTSKAASSPLCCAHTSEHAIIAADERVQRGVRQRQERQGEAGRERRRTRHDGRRGQVCQSFMNFLGSIWGIGC